MTDVSTLRRGWCPGALTPMETGDGLLVRVRPRAGEYTSAQLRAVAHVAMSCGNGEVDLTNRANLQIRGVSSGTFGQVIAALRAAGLVDETAAVEAVRNVVVSPFAGLEGDTGGLAVHDLARALEAALARDERLWALPGKFGFAVDSTDAPLGRHGGWDIQMTVAETGVRLRADSAGATVAVVDVPSAVPGVTSLAHQFLAARESDPTVRRMRDAVARVGGTCLFERAGLRPSAVERTESDAPQVVGLIGSADHPIALAIGLPYGRIAAASLAKLADAAIASDVGAIRASPGRSLVFPLVGRSADGLSAVARAAGLIISHDDRRLGLDVCPGAPACARATTSTRADADAIARHLDQKAPFAVSVHVSGCAKGCARSAPADFTCVARDGLYDVIREGTTLDGPVRIGIAGRDLPTVIASLKGGGFG